MNELKQIVQPHHRLRHIARGASAGAASRPESVILPRQQSAPTSALWLHEQLRWTAADREVPLGMAVIKSWPRTWWALPGCDHTRASHTAGTALRQPGYSTGNSNGWRGLRRDLPPAPADSCTKGLAPSTRVEPAATGARKCDHDKHFWAVWSEATKDWIAKPNLFQLNKLQRNHTQR
jgi:hypothetical protein